MLTIKTDISDCSWLQYIIDEFKIINGAKFDIEIIELDKNTVNQHVFYYVTNPSQFGLCIFNAASPNPTRRVKYVSEKIFILENTESYNFCINYDLFWNAFVFLSRFEEYLSELDGKLIKSQCKKHPRMDKETFKIPIVNILFNEFEAFIKKHFPDLQFEEKKCLEIDISHDVDYINKTLQLLIKQTTFNLLNTFKVLYNPKKFIKNLLFTLRFLLMRPSYWCFDYWVEVEKKNNVYSTFYIYSRVKRNNFKTWLLDPSYDIQHNKKLQKQLKDLLNDGFFIGLHGSYDSAKSLPLLEQEKDQLEAILGTKISKTRQHWLHYSELTTPDIHDKLFSLDSSLGWNDQLGFRSGIASIYRPYNFKNKKAYNYEVLPQVIMDSTIFDYYRNKNLQQEIDSILVNAKDYAKNPHVSISWHQRVCNQDYRWHKIYEDIINAL